MWDDDDDANDKAHPFWSEGGPILPIRFVNDPFLANDDRYRELVRQEYGDDGLKDDRNR